MFKNPQAFRYLFLCLPVMYILFLRYKTGKRDLIRLGGVWREFDLANIFLVKWFFSSLLFVLFIVFITLSLASPAWGSYTKPYNPGGLDVAFVVDLSRSMMAEDVVPNRLSRTKATIQGLAESLGAQRYAVVGFKGKGVVVMPPTEDRETLFTLVERLSIDLITAGSTNLEEGLKASLKTFPQNTDSRRLVVLFSDGESLLGDPLKASELALQGDIIIYTVGVGTEEGANIPMYDGSVLLDSSGRAVITRMNRNLLEELALKTGGKFFLLNDPMVLTKMISVISDDFQDIKRRGFIIEGRDQYRVFLASAIAVIFIIIILRIIPWKNTL